MGRDRRKACGVRREGQRERDGRGGMKAEDEEVGGTAEVGRQRNEGSGEMGSVRWY